MSEVHLVPVVNPPEPLPCHLSWYNLCGSTADVFIVEGGQYVCKKHGVEFKRLAAIANPMKSSVEDIFRALVQMARNEKEA
ncbi:MAG: hypothetical protein UY24_C0002G0011 [Parcubacteria group bacterium GW2011_GWA1_48_11b]|uniref:Uncharacterized protein n=2 Tax=Parcubacteria group TaxID=1794811 RepID=A0A0G1T6C4_9BACT|nr:MAG: hypothetical protein UY02_C0003G0011 [Candidatus Giovannonibacteria bacterium GW2011_GWB1_47_6b]KKU95197.1 MAG: hypothetical protein UY24_C0002G0011 [Parcubacteria group bacterium GW2011_GWA1_48_11b]OGY63415.1 MAG: hypothetical protein A3E64_01755 [Candidatus Harrisonbacteria bacterium RIFCSPHIGHO2_12_FULL_48_16]